MGFSTDILLYLENDTRCAYIYYGRPIENI